MKITANLATDAAQIRADALREAVKAIAGLKIWSPYSGASQHSRIWVQGGIACAKACEAAILALIDQPAPTPPDLRLHAVSVEPDAGGALPAPGVAGPTAAQLQRAAYTEAVRNCAVTIKSMRATDGLIDERTRSLFLAVLDDIAANCDRMSAFDDKMDAREWNQTPGVM